MKSALVLKPCLAGLAVFLVSSSAWAGEPIPDIDVILKQNPGGVIAECTPPNCPDRWVIDFTKDFAGATSPVNLPEGWTFEVDGKKIVLAGPAPDRPTRFKLGAGEAKRPQKISYRASLGGRTLVERKNVKLTPVAPRQQIGSLQGIVTMPTEVAPGEPMKMQVSEGANLPAGGTWSLSGVVVDDEERKETDDSTSGEPKRRVALAVAPGQDVPDQDLGEIAAVLAAQGAPEGTWEVVALDDDSPLDETTAELWTVAQPTEGRKFQTVSNVSKMKHDVAMAAIRNIRAEIATKPTGGSGPGVYSVRPTDVGEEAAGPVIVVTGLAVREEDVPVGDSPPHVTIEQEEVFFTGESPPRPTIAGGESSSEDAGSGTGKLHYFDLTGDPLVDGRTTLFSLNYNSSRSNKKTPSSSITSADPDGTVVFEHLPEDLQPGSPISMQYIDKFGDMLVDVPSVPDVEVVEPRGDGEARITDATPRSFAGQSVCVCGTFPGEAAWNGVLLDGQSAGSPGSASGQMVSVQLPAGLTPGEHVFTGTAAAGFPAADRASTLVLQVGGEIDSTKLQKLQTTPMRLWVIGTEEPVDLRVRNLTPAIISIDGGNDQTIRTSGGARNMLERSVQGLTPGAFDIKYELAGEPCPCGAPSYIW